MPTHRRKFSAEFKAKIVLEVLSGRSSIAARLLRDLNAGRVLKA